MRDDGWRQVRANSSRVFSILFFLILFLPIVLLLLERNAIMKRIHGALSFLLITATAELLIVLAKSDGTGTDCAATNKQAPPSSAVDEDVYDHLSVRPPSKRLQNSKKLSSFKRFVWRLHGHLIPLLHFGTSPPSEVCVNLRVLWCKAISSLDRKSPVYEHPHFWTYNLLPKYSRWILWVTPSWLFPRWFHANIELRSAFLKRSIDKVISAQRQQQQQQQKKIIRIVLLGGGYDTKAIQLLDAKKIHQVWEFDLPKVVNYKKQILEKRKHLGLHSKDIQLVGIDLNDHQALKSVLSEMMTLSSRVDDDGWYTIVVAEAIFLYLKPGIPEKLLQVCKESFGRKNFCLCFADRFTGISSSTQEEGMKFFSSIGYNLIDWLPKQGATRHMGIACPL